MTDAGGSTLAGSRSGCLICDKPRSETVATLDDSCPLPTPGRAGGPAAATKARECYRCARSVLSPICPVATAPSARTRSRMLLHPARQRLLLASNPHPERERVGDRERHRRPPGAEHERGREQLDRDREIIRVPEPAIDAAAHQRGPFQHDHPRCPALAQCPHGCHAQELCAHEQSDPQHREPPGSGAEQQHFGDQRQRKQRMHGDQHREVFAAMFACTACDQGSYMARRDDELDRPVQQVIPEERDQADDRDRGRPRRAHAAGTRASRDSAQEPGPSAESTAVSPAAMVRAVRKRSSTNRQVGDDMLPWSRSTARAWSSAQGLSSSAFSKAASTFIPPGCETRWSRRSSERPSRMRNASSPGRTRSCTMVGMSRAKITCRPSESTSQPITSSVSGQKVLADATRSSPPWPFFPGAWSSATTSAAAAPSPNSDDATRLRLERSLRWNVSVHSSSAMSSTLEPGWASANSRARASPATPPAQPRPQIGVRWKSPSRPSTLASRASMLGAAIPVEETNTR